MLYQIVSLLLDLIGGLFAGACLLRLYMQMQRIPFHNPIGNLVFALSDWLVMPLRKVIPAIGRVDTASLVGALLVQLVQYSLLTLFWGVGFSALSILWLAVFGVFRVAISGMMGLILVSVVLSWVQTRSSLTDAINRLCEPVLRPLRRVIPLVGGFDFSPLVAMVILQILLIVLGHLKVGAL